MRPRPNLKAVAAVAAFAAFSIWVTWRAKSIELTFLRRSELVGRLAPEFNVESIDGRKISLGEYSGKTRVLTFWASWCAPCRMELPILARFYERTHQPDSDFEIFAVSIDRTRKDAEDGAKSLNLTFPVLLDLDNRVAGSFRVEAIPMLFIIDKLGKITYSYTGFQMGIEVLLAQQLGIRNYNPASETKR